MARSTQHGVIAQEVGKIRGLEATHMIVDEIGSLGIGSLNLSTISIGGGVAHGAITGSTLMGTAGKALMHSGIEYQAQNFNDRPTLFGAPLRIRIAIPTYLTRSGEDHEKRLVRDNSEKLQHAIKKDCADCEMCPHMQVNMTRHVDAIRDESVYELTAACRNKSGNSHSLLCPNGKTAVRQGSTVLVPKVETTFEPTFHDIPGTSVHELKPEPYIRKDPDKPTSDTGEAW